MQDHFREEVANDQIFRMAILKSIQAFSALSDEHLTTAAQSIISIYVHRGDVVFEQDEIGDAMYIIESGTISLSRKPPEGGEKDMGRLSKGSYFGEMSLLTREPRSATVKVFSQTAKLLKMTKDVFDDIVSASNAANARANMIVGREVVNKVPLFQTLTAAYRQKVLDTMTPMGFMPGTYICRQGTLGNTFYIIISGSCKVTVNNPDGKGEKEVAKLEKGDFFGNIFIIILFVKKNVSNEIKFIHVRTCLILKAKLL